MTIMYLLRQRRSHTTDCEAELRPTATLTDAVTDATDIDPHQQLINCLQISPVLSVVRSLLFAALVDGKKTLHNMPNINDS